jgi:transcription elongation factor GreA
MGLTRPEFDELARELHTLRERHQTELAARLRDARAYGSPGDNEDVHAVHEEASVLEARIARLEELVRAAPIVDREFDGRVSIGCTVRVAGAGGRVAEYVLVGRRSDSSSPHDVSPGSPVGQALMGARTGQVVRAELPNGRSRELRVLAVTPPAARLGVEAA